MKFLFFQSSNRTKISLKKGPKRSYHAEKESPSHSLSRVCKKEPHVQLLSGQSSLPTESKLFIFRNFYTRANFIPG